MRNSTAKKQPRRSSKLQQTRSWSFLKKKQTCYHIPIELSNLIYFLLKSLEENFASLVAAVTRKREVRLVVPGKFTPVTKKLWVATVLSIKILKEKNKHSHCELSFDDSKNLKRP